MRITILVENTTNKGSLLAEHGWSVLIEIDDKKILFDTGGGHTILHNAKALKKDLSKLDAIILSHHHYDHTDGLAQVLKETGPIRVYSHPDLFKESYSIENDKKRFVGMSHKKDYLESLGARFILDKNYREIFPQIFLSGEIPRKTAFEKGDKKLQIKSSQGFIQDPLLDDQALIIKREKGLVIILGCAHSGLINTLDHVIDKTGVKRINYLLGGTHLGPASRHQRRKTYRALIDYQIENIGVSHCTGNEAAFELKEIYDRRFFFSNVGLELEID